MVNKTFKLASVFFCLCLVISFTSGCSKNDQSTAASPTPPTIDTTSQTIPSPTVNTTSSTSSQLSFKKSLFVKKGADGKVIPVESSIFQRGENVTLVLLKTGKFKKGADGKNWLDLDMHVKTPQGKILASQQSLLGDQGKVVLKDDIADPNGTVNTTPKVEPGVYQMTLNVYDRIAGTQISETKAFTLK